MADVVLDTNIILDYLCPTREKHLDAVDVLEQKVAGQIGPARASGAAPAPSPEQQKMPLPREEPQA